MDEVNVATFRLDVTPPAGSPLCGGWIAPVSSVADPLLAIGAVLLTEDAPILLCAVDWCQINNEAHLRWQRELARALHTTPDRICLHAVHQHNAPIVDLEAQRLVEEAAGLPRLMDLAHYQRCVERTSEAARAAVAAARPVDAVAVGAAAVREVASARRILGPDGKVRLTRWSSTRDPELRQAPEGTIDPLLRTVSLLDGSAPVVRLHFYATHPMSFYGDGAVSADFAGLARERRRGETPGCEQLYFNGCGGNVTAGKYNEGTPESRARLSERVHEAMVESERCGRAVPLGRVSWASVAVVLPPRPDLATERLEASIRDAARTPVERKTAALKLAYLRRLATPTTVARLRVGSSGDVLFLPGEPFVEYQLLAASRGSFVAVAGYGDTGTGYLPLARSFGEGGYEVDASSVSGEAEAILRAAMDQLLAP